MTAVLSRIDNSVNQSQIGSQPSRISFINNITPTFWTASQILGDNFEDASDNDTVMTENEDDGEFNTKPKSQETLEVSENKEANGFTQESYDGLTKAKSLPSILKKPQLRSIPV